MNDLVEALRDILFLPEGASEMALAIDTLHFVVIGTSMLGAVAVALVTTYFVIRYRRRGENDAPARVFAPLWYELMVIGTILTLFVGFWVAGYQQFITIHETSPEATDVYVTGKQWMWKFAHPSGRSTVGMLVVPKGRPIRLMLTSRDVIHSFFVPALRVKRDAVPGRYTSLGFVADRTGVFPAYCAEFCGLSHSQMWADVVVLEPAEHEAWLNGEIPPLVARAEANAKERGGRVGVYAGVSLAETGAEVAARVGCLSCHTLDGQRHIAPSFRGLYLREVELASGARVIADPDYLTESMMEPDAKQVAGFDPVMPTYRGVLSSFEVTALVELIRSVAEEDDDLPRVDLPLVNPMPSVDAGPDAAVLVPPPRPMVPSDAGLSMDARGPALREAEQ